MKLTYVGHRQFKNRLAEFSYTDSEEKRFMKIADYLQTECGYNVDTGVMNWAAIEVEDKAEFDEVMKDFREAKKIIKK